jgi:hypothetical protein
LFGGGPSVGRYNQPTTPLAVHDFLGRWLSGAFPKSQLRQTPGLQVEESTILKNNLLAKSTKYQYFIQYEP